MNCLLATLAIEGAALDPLGVKEAVAMAVEHLGNVRVLRVDTREPEQLKLDGIASEQQGTSSAPARLPVPVSSTEQGPASMPRPRGSRSRPVAMACCLTCEFYRQQGGQDGAGKFFWGICRKTGRPVHDLKNQCDSWVSKEGWA